jgi:hypothetical protein
MATEPVRRMRPVGLLIVIAGAVMMAVAAFTPVTFGPESLFRDVHRLYFVFDDAIQYAAALLLSSGIAIAAVWGLAHPGSRSARRFVIAGGIVAIAAWIVMAVFVFQVSLPADRLTQAFQFQPFQLDQPAVKSAYVRGLVALAVGVLVVVTGVIVARPRSLLAEPELAASASGAVLGFIGGLILIVADFAVLALWAEASSGHWNGRRPYMTDVAWTFWEHRLVHMGALLPGVAVIIVALWALASPGSRRASRWFLVVASTVAAGIVAATVVSLSRPGPPGWTAFVLRLAAIAGVGALFALVGAIALSRGSRSAPRPGPSDRRTRSPA